MATITDLQWQQLATALGGSNKIFLGEDLNGDIGLLISVSAVNTELTSALTNEGVVKFMTRLREAAHLAQQAVNQDQEVGEKLNAFPPAISNGSINDGYVQQTGAINSRIAISSATQIIGSTLANVE